MTTMADVAERAGVGIGAEQEREIGIEGVQTGSHGRDHGLGRRVGVARFGYRRREPHRIGLRCGSGRLIGLAAASHRFPSDAAKLPARIAFPKAATSIGVAGDIR